MAVFNVTAEDDAFSGIAVDTSVLDNFNRANENPLSGGGRWTLSGTFDVSFQLFSNGVIPTSGSKSSQNSYGAAGDLTDCEVWATISSLPASGNYVGVTARQDPAVATGKNYYECIYLAGLGVLVDWTDSGGAVHTLATYAQAVSAGDSIGLRVKGSTLTAYYKPSGGSWTALGSVTDTNLTHGYIGITGFPVVGGGKLDDFGGGAAPLSDQLARTTQIVDTGLTISDSIQGPAHITDTGLSLSDTLMRGSQVSLSDTGLASSDSLSSTTVRGRTITDAGLALSTTLASLRLRPLTDTGLIVTDSLRKLSLLIDTGLTLAVSLRKSVFKPLTDTGLSVTDSVGRIELADTGLAFSDSLRAVPVRPLADTGATSGDTLAKTVRKVLSDAGAAFSDGLVVRKNGANTSVGLTDTGLALTDSLSKTIVLFLSVPAAGALPEIGLQLTDGIGVTVNGGPADSCTLDFRRFLADLDASPEYGAWCATNPGDCSAWTTYAAQILAGGAPAPPAMGDPFGTALVDAGIIALDGIVPCRTKPPPSRSPHAAFSFAVSGLTVYFNNLSTPGESGLFDSWLWDFGDGATDTTDWDPAYVYAGAGTYTVTLTVVGSDSDGISSVRHFVTVFVPSTTGIHIDAVAL